jgi:hypothetical protein
MQFLAPRDYKFGDSTSSTTSKMTYQLPKRINIEELGKFTN